MDISDWITHHARCCPDKVAVNYEGEQITYAALENRVGRLAGLLRNRLDIQPGDRVAHLGLNSAELLDLLFACARVRAILVPLNWRLTVSEHDWQIGDSAPSVMFADPEYHDHAARLHQQHSDITLVAYGKVQDGPAAAHQWVDYAGEMAGVGALPSDPGCPLDIPLMIVYTSGTTGRPKGAVLNQTALFYAALNSLDVFDITRDDHILTVIPMFHVGGMNIQTVPAIYAGATVSIYRRFDPEVALKAIAADRPTLFSAVPAINRAISSLPEFEATDISSLRCVTTGSSTVPGAVFRPWLDRGIPVNQVYGMTESGPTAIAVPVADGFTRSTSAGRAVRHCEVRIVDDGGKDTVDGTSGEIWLRGPGLLTEYWRNPEATAEAITEDGWFKTGDVAHYDDEGWVYVDDRKKDMIISGGENIYPAELENVLADCDRIAEFSIVGKPDERWGETPIAVVLLKDGAQMTEEEVLGLFQGQLARYKHPRGVVFASEPLPRTTLGKVQKFELKNKLFG